MSQDLDAANRAKIIGDLKALGCTLNDKELASMSTEELDGLRDASRLFKGTQPSAGVKAFGDASDLEDPRGKITTPDHFLSSLKKGGSQ